VNPRAKQLQLNSINLTQVLLAVIRDSNPKITSMISSLLDHLLKLKSALTKALKLAQEANKLTTDLSIDDLLDIVEFNLSKSCALLKSM
jgi:hypothetical protein